MRLLMLVPFLLVACGPVRRGWDQGWSAHAAQDRIMLVRQEPETLGHRRLVYQSTDHPDLGAFLGKRGFPDFIAETSTDDREYLILYYLDSRRAFACRTHRGAGKAIDFAGPYPMTERETNLLKDMKRNSRVDG
ncbi:hypothetical protein [Luteolibacter marinus]|uniref:hypothetical protein n=1 Tax=Luteolibacter marinus TaxID=2776705 RepID=UPI001868C957|nr:hypothetical protein [Luteolibacter marinus]